MNITATNITHAMSGVPSIARCHDSHCSRPGQLCNSCGALRVRVESFRLHVSLCDAITTRQEPSRPLTSIRKFGTRERYRVEGGNMHSTRPTSAADSPLDQVLGGCGETFELTLPPTRRAIQTHRCPPTYPIHVSRA